MLAANEECPPSPLPQFPPPSSKFEDYGFGVWSEDHWDAAEEAAELFPDPYKSTLLQLCCSRGPSAAWCFLLVYQNAYANFTNVTVVPSPLLWTAPVVVETAQPVALAASTAKELPDASMFAYNDGSWGPKDWKRAREVAARFPDDAKAQGRLMVRCHYNDEEGFVLAYQELIQQVSSRHFSPLGHLKRCIRTTMKKKNITVPWVKVEGVTSIVSTLSYFVASSGAAYTFTNRTIVPRSGGNMWNMRPICAVKLPPSCTGHTMLEPHQVCKGVVHVLSGESGSGKTTWALMTSDFGIYLTPSDFGLGSIYEARNTFETDDKDKAEAKWNELVVEALHDAVERVLGGFFAPPAEFRSGPPVTIALVLDEFGGHPSVVRGLCAAMFDDIHTKLNPLFNFAVELKVIVVGTGTDLKHKEIGIHPDTHVALRMPSTSMMPAMQCALESLHGAPAAATLVQALKSHTQAVHLTHNPRFAACLLKRLVDFCDWGRDCVFDELIPSVEAARSCVDAYLFAAARDFKLLNAMNMVTRENVALYYKHAIGLLLRNPQDGRRLTNVEFILQLQVGVLTDCAFWTDVLPAGHVEVDAARTEETNRQGEMVSLILVAPTTGRYAMSMAQHLLFRMCYGFDEFLPAASWQRAEVVFAEYVSVLLSGLNGQRLRELLVRLGMPEACCENAALLEQTMSFGAVSTVHSGKWICPADRCRNADDVTTTDTGATREEFARLLLQQCEPPIRGSGRTEAEARKRAEGTAVVIVNAPGAPYAGVIVVIRRVAVILIQCKMLGDETEVVDIEADAEKLSGELTELNKMAGVPPGAYFRVLATHNTIDRAPHDLHGLFLFETSAKCNALATMLELTCCKKEVASVNDDIKVVRQMEKRLREKQTRKHGRDE